MFQTKLPRSWRTFVATGCIAGFAASAPAATVHSENFESYSAGDFPADWSLSATNNDGSADDDVEVVNLGGSRLCLRIDDDDTSTARSAIKSWTAQTNSNTMFLAVRLAQTDRVVTTFMYDRFGRHAVRLRFDNNGNVQVRHPSSGWQTIDSYSADTWYRLRITMDVDNQTYDVYFNREGWSGELEANDYPFHDGADAIASVRVETPMSGSNCTIYLDNLKVTGSTNASAAFGCGTTYGGDAIGGGGNRGGFVGSDTTYSDTFSWDSVEAMEGTRYDHVWRVGNSSGDYVGESGLVDALAAAASVGSGDTVLIYVSSSLSVNRTNNSPLDIPANTTLASNRGYSASHDGALIYMDSYDSLIDSAGNNVRVTGFRLRGPQSTVGSSAIYSNCVRLFHDNGEVDNCEIYNWTHTGVNVRNDGAHVHHNYIHHVQGSGLGYPVALYTTNSDATIEGNIFDRYRHAVATSGDAGQEYTVRYNFFSANGTSFAVEAHPDNGSGIDINCKRLRIYNNTHEDSNDRFVHIRGVPQWGVFIYNNWIKNPPSPDADAIMQNFSRGRFFVERNKFDTTVKVAHFGMDD